MSRIQAVTTADLAVLHTEVATLNTRMFNFHILIDDVNFFRPVALATISEEALFDVRYPPLPSDQQHNF